MAKMARSAPPVSRKFSTSARISASSTAVLPTCESDPQSTRARGDFPGAGGKFTSAGGKFISAVGGRARGTHLRLELAGARDTWYS
eukprot:3220224-Pyramimonas_sp.AAC.1